MSETETLQLVLGLLRHVADVREQLYALQLASLKSAAIPASIFIEAQREAREHFAPLRGALEQADLTDQQRILRLLKDFQGPVQ